jgi:DNA-binding MarR family transcriptional regulator
VKLEDEIKQAQFKTEHHKLMINILYTASWLQRTQSTVLRPHGITPEQYNILRILRGAKGKAMSLNDISSRMIDRASNTSRLIDKLITKEWVNRTICPKDRRQSEILITQKGLDVLHNLQKPIDEISEQFFIISEKECQKLNNVLDEMRNINNPI